MKNDEYVINEKKMMKFFFDMHVIFCRHYFFIEELWRKVKKFKKADRAEVEIAFLLVWFKNATGIMTYPIGYRWCHICNDPEDFNNFVKKFQPVFTAYSEWCMDQR